MNSSNQPILQMSGITKSFGKVKALRGVDFEIHSGECVALVGENGAGKSTLMKILSGVWPQGSFEGKYLYKGTDAALNNPLDGRRRGISIIHQELCLYPKLTVAENLFLSEEAPYSGSPSQKMFRLVNWGMLQVRAKELMKELGFDIDVEAPIESLSVAGRQLVEIARAFHQKAEVLVLDEPTSALSSSEVSQLFRVIRSMRDKMSFVYISHKLDEVFELSDRIVVLRDGKTVQTLKTSETDASEVIRHMVGRPFKEQERTSHKGTECVLKVRNLMHVDPKGRRLIERVSFDVHAGEIVGIAGLMGAGRSELLRSIVGILPGHREGSVEYFGKSTQWNGMWDAMNSGVAFLPEDRKKEGLFLDHGIDFNMTLTVLDKFERAKKLDLESEQGFVQKFAKKMLVKYGQPTDPVKTLSGGNQQKVLLARVMAHNPKLLLLDEPTRGIDIGAKDEIYQLIRNFAKQGLAVVVVSSELPEILSLSDRVIVLRSGKITADLENIQLGQEKIMSYAAEGSEVGNHVHA